ncbi:MAG: hypothetical protein LBD84_03725 [Campylobacteraceae bacterium]|nr:hypothetical protein [Campylobacteraceae bacterium]
MRILIAQALGIKISEIFQDKNTIDFLKEYIENPNDELKELIINKYSGVSKYRFNTYI